MKIPSDVRRLTRLFEKFGARDPELWARSQAREGIPQFQRFLFLRQAWRNVLEEKNVAWIDREVQRSRRYPGGPMLFQLCYLLDDPMFTEPELSEFCWGLFEVDGDDKPVGPRIGSLHESVLGTDPTGREMRPREAKKKS